MLGPPTLGSKGDLGPRHGDLRHWTSAAPLPRIVCGGTAMAALLGNVGIEPAPGPADTMSGADALLWTISTDPVMRPTIVAVMIVGGTPKWGEVRARVGALTEALPRLRSRAMSRGPARIRPQFVVDPDFDLDLHLRRMRVSGSGGRRHVLDMAQNMATTGFDHALPLWEAVL